MFISLIAKGDEMRNYRVHRNFALPEEDDFRANVMPGMDYNEFATPVYQGSTVIAWDVKPAYE